MAETLPELTGGGYIVVWSGYAAITTCVHDRDFYQFGAFVFLCNQFTYEYPYHYGDVFLVTAAFEHEGRAAVLAKMCMGETGACIPGSLLMRR
ncbi:hypothetical protein [Mesorhizobium marinum]|uniref:hypothetical protein n=1 Tax=Mesorhizobium marinum TaxID=3228790 RepID=UPI0034665261